jgi:hypothetical protein
MTWKFGRRTAVVALALLVANCADAPKPKPVGRVDNKSMRAAPQVETQAAALVGFVRQAGEVGPTFSGPSSVSAAVQVGAAYEPKQLEAGLIGLAAVAALQDPAFVAGVRKSAAREGSQALARRIANDPTAAAKLPGASGAAGRARGALARQGSVLTQRGEAIRATSYSIQKQAWSKAKVSDASGRLSRAKAAGKAARRVGADDQAQLYRAAADAGVRSGGNSAVVSRGVAAAALSVVGDEKAAARMLAEPRAGMCVRMAKLNYHQCLASAGPYYEDIYCLGRHAIQETGQCVTQAAGAARLASR